MINPPAWICVIAAILANGLSGTGLVLQRKAAVKLGTDSTTPVWRRQLWQLGVVLTIVGAVVDFFSYLGAPIVVCTLISSARLPYITILSSFVLDESVTRVLIVAISCCATGAVVVIMHLPHHEARLYRDYADFFEPSVTQYFVWSAIIITILPMLMMSHRSNHVPSTAFPLCSALTLSLTKALNVLFNKVENPPSEEVILVLAGLTLLSSYTLLLNVVGVQKVQPSIWAPVFFGFFNCLCLFQSLLIFREFERHVDDIPMAMVGMMLCVIGALCCQYSNPSKSKSKQLWIDLAKLENEEREAMTTMSPSSADVNETIASPYRYVHDMFAPPSHQPRISSKKFGPSTTKFGMPRRDMLKYQSIR